MAERTERSEKADLDAGSLEREIDRLSLEQALRDFEIANSRVVDLTQRLIAANERAAEVQRQYDALAVAHAELTARHQAMQGSKAFKIADRIWTIRNALGW